jgi:NADH:ubiquinone oxidoreductase subunit E
MNKEAVIANGKQATEVLPEHIVQFIEEAMKQPHSESQLIAVLQLVQKHYKYLPKDCLDAVSQLMRIPAAKVTGVATFYHLFSLTPKGQHIISVCLGTACYVKGAGLLHDRLKEMLKIDENNVSADGLFSLEAQRCVGACALAPVVMVDDKVYGNVQPDDLQGILDEYGFEGSQKG